ncbi:MAG: hypothetical protein Q4D42_06635 [Eubacteriales bacterium]|nr:hypothetical protein [Eubacteriales bacterium]
MLDVESCKQILIDEAGLSAGMAEVEAQQLFSQQGSADGERQFIRYICYEYAEEYPDCPVGFGFIAAVTAGDEPIYKEICYVYSAVADDQTGYFEPGANSAVIVDDTTVQIHADGELTVSGKDTLQRYEVSCYRKVDFTQFYPAVSR